MTQPATTLRPEIADAGRIRIGAGYKLPPQATAPAAVKDNGRIRVGAGYKIRRAILG